MSTLSIIATPIGNLEDLTFRALRALREADVILCEDTRVTKRLLDRYGLRGKPLVPYNERKSGLAAERVIALLAAGKNLALVSDAGTPGISDPGSFLVRKVRENLPETRIVAVPGPSALAAALSVAGVPAQEFVFLGFLPHKKGRETLFREIAAAKRACVFYESPHRIVKTLEALAEYAPGKTVALARELTKVYEEVISGSAGELLEHFEKNPDKVRGEFVALVTGRFAK